MRVTTEFWAGALIRRCFAAGAAAYVVRRGAAEAGAVIVTVERGDRTIDLYQPAPQSVFDSDRPTDRLFQMVRSGVDPAETAAWTERQLRFDPDLWVLAIEDRDGRSFLDVVTG